MQMGLKTRVSKANYFARSLTALHWPSFHKSQQELGWAEVHAGQWKSAVFLQVSQQVEKLSKKNYLNVGLAFHRGAGRHK